MQQVQSDFWRNKRVFITGHTGFKGSWLALWLQKMGAELHGYALTPPTSPNLFDVARVGDAMQSTFADVRDAEKLQAAIADFKPEIVFHLAAQPLVRHSYQHPVETYATNVMGTVHLLEAIRQVGGVKAIVNVTSDKCYENREWPWGYREQDPMGGYDPYSNSKGCAELVAAAYRQSYFNPENFSEHGCALASVRAGNVIGGGDWAEDRLIPDMLSAFADQRTVTLRHPHAIRPWQHVFEPLSGYLVLAERLYQDGAAFAKGWNFGPHDEDAQSVAWIADKLCQLWGGNAAWQLTEIEHPHEAHYLKLDCSQAHQQLNWKPRWNLPETLKRIVEWQQAYLTGQDMARFCRAEIEDYYQEQ